MATPDQPLAGRDPGCSCVGVCLALLVLCSGLAGLRIGLRHGVGFGLLGIIAGVAAGIVATAAMIVVELLLIGALIFIDSLLPHLSIGDRFFRVVRRWPWIFAVFALVGLGVGAWISWVNPPDPSRVWLFKAIGILCIIFYGGLLILLVVKLRDGTWRAFCDDQASQLG